MKIHRYRVSVFPLTIANNLFTRCYQYLRISLRLHSTLPSSSCSVSKGISIFHTNHLINVIHSLTIVVLSLRLSSNEEKIGFLVRIANRFDRESNDIRDKSSILVHISSDRNSQALQSAFAILNQICIHQRYGNDQARNLPIKLPVVLRHASSSLSLSLSLALSLLLSLTHTLFLFLAV